MITSQMSISRFVNRHGDIDHTGSVKDEIVVRHRVNTMALWLAQGTGIHEDEVR